MQRLSVTGYLVPSEHLAPALGSLTGVRQVHAGLILAEGPEQRCAWAQNVWREPYVAPFASVTDAVKRLTATQRNWWPYAARLHRRTALIASALPHVSARLLEFPSPAPTAPLGSFALLDEHTLLCSPACSSSFPNGTPRFIEYSEREGPPSRAYLKLFEALTLLGAHPTAGQHCLELGASPGGWTWVLSRFGARVTAVDRAPLAPNVSKLPGVTSLRTSAFGLSPEQVGGVDWLFSDVVCYPDKLMRYLERWLHSGKCERFVCTLKFQGQQHYDIIDPFLERLGGRLVHLSHNRHELTWLRVPEMQSSV